MVVRRRRLALLCLPLVVACASEKEPTAADGDGTTADAPATTGETPATDDASTGEPGTEVDGPTYYEDILPVFVQQCNGCHAAGGIGPYDLSMDLGVGAQMDHAKMKEAIARIWAAALRAGKSMWHRRNKRRWTPPTDACEA